MKPLKLTKWYRTNFSTLSETLRSDEFDNCNIRITFMSSLNAWFTLVIQPHQKVITLCKMCEQAHVKTEYLHELQFHVCRLATSTTSYVSWPFPTSFLLFLPLFPHRLSPLLQMRLSAIFDKFGMTRRSANISLQHMANKLKNDVKIQIRTEKNKRNHLIRI